MSNFATVDPAREQQLTRMARDLSSLYSELAAPKQKESFSLSRMLKAMTDRQLAGTFEGDVLRAAAAAQGEMFDPQSVVIPMGLLASRDLTVGVTSAGGNLVGARTGGIRDVLWEKSTAMRLGVQTEENLLSDLLIPTVTNPAGPGDAPSSATIATGQWLANENSSLTPSDVTIGVSSSKPKTGGGILRASYNFVNQSRQSERFLRDHLTSMIANLIDRAVFQGSGASGEPIGLSNTSGLSINSTGSFDYTNASSMIAWVSDEGSMDEDIKFLATPWIRSLLMQKPDTSWGSNRLWRKGSVLDFPAMASMNCPTDTLFCGDWKQIMLAIWGAGPRIEIDPYTLFKTGGVQVRVLVHADVIVNRPRNFAKWSSLS